MTIHEAAAEIIAKLDEARSLALPRIQTNITEEERRFGKRVHYYELMLEQAKMVDRHHGRFSSVCNDGQFLPEKIIIDDGKDNKWPGNTEEFTVFVKGENKNRGEYQGYRIGWRLFFTAVTLVSEEAQEVIKSHFGGFQGFRVV